MKSLPFSLSPLLLLLTGCQTSPKNADAPAPLVKEAQAQASASQAVPSTDMMITSSGLRYRVLASGPASGRSPGRSNSVTVHYRGTLTDGTVFDSSYDRGEPATFGVSQVIPGWTEALQLMKPGDKWLLNIPANLAYGGRAVGDKIPPFSDLIFQVELLQVSGG
ncbi:hypothetical protein BH11VER1_BH11VER1_40780 [soil metagenome]